MPFVRYYRLLGFLNWESPWLRGASEPSPQRPEFPLRRRPASPGPPFRLPPKSCGRASFLSVPFRPPPSFLLHHSQSRQETPPETCPGFNLAPLHIFLRRPISIFCRRSREILESGTLRRHQLQQRDPVFRRVIIRYGPVTQPQSHAARVSLSARYASTRRALYLLSIRLVDKGSFIHYLLRPKAPCKLQPLIPSSGLLPSSSSSCATIGGRRTHRDTDR